nr:hypothetical protein [Actinoplanes rishiriensis]
MQPLVGDVVQAVRDVVPDGALEQHRLLRHHRDEAAGRAQVEPLHVGAVQQDPAGARADEAEHQVEHRGLAGAGRADEGHRLAGTYVQVDAGQRVPGGARMPVGDLGQGDPAGDPVHPALALVVLQVGFLQHLGDRAHRLHPAGRHRDQTEQLDEALGEQCEVGREQHHVAGADRQGAGQREHRRERQAGDAEELHAHPGHRRGLTVEHVHPQRGTADALHADGHPGRGGLLQAVRAGDRDERGHLADPGREALHLAAEPLVALPRPAAQGVPDQQGQRHGQQIDRQELGHHDRGHHGGAGQHHDGRQQRVRHLLEHELDVLDVADHLVLHDRRTGPGVKADGQALQPRGQPVPQVGTGVPDDQHEVARVDQVVRIVLHEQHGRHREPGQHRGHLAAPRHDIDDRRGDDRQHPERNFLEHERADRDRDTPRPPPQQPHQREDRTGPVNERGRGKRLPSHCQESSEKCGPTRVTCVTTTERVRGSHCRRWSDLSDPGIAATRTFADGGSPSRPGRPVNRQPTGRTPATGHRMPGSAGHIVSPSWTADDHSTRRDAPEQKPLNTL